MMKKNYFIISIIVLILITLIIISADFIRDKNGKESMFFNKNKTKEVQKDLIIETEFQIIVKERDSLSDDVLLQEIANSYFKNEAEIYGNIYLYGLKSVDLIINNESYTLNEALNQKIISIDEIISKLKVVESLSEENTNVYRDINKIKVAESNLTVVMCNESSDELFLNKDIYLGNKDLKIEPFFCLDNVMKTG